MDKALAPNAYQPPPFEKLKRKVEDYVQIKTEESEKIIREILSEKRMSNDEANILKKTMEDLKVKKELEALKNNPSFADEKNDFKVGSKTNQQDDSD